MTASAQLSKWLCVASNKGGPFLAEEESFESSPASAEEVLTFSVNCIQPDTANLHIEKMAQRCGPVLCDRLSVEAVGLEGHEQLC